MELCNCITDSDCVLLLISIKLWIFLQ